MSTLDTNIISKEQVLMEALQDHQKTLKNLFQLNQNMQQELKCDHINNNDKINKIKSVHKAFRNSQQFSFISNLSLSFIYSLL